MYEILKTEWLTHVNNVLTAAFKVANVINDGLGNVLIYCEDGTNCTPVLTSLAQIALDPYYRTF